MKKEPRFMYDEMSGRLFISTKKKSDKIDESDKIYGSVRVLNLILDFTTDYKVANIELLDASEYLESLDIDPSILSKLKEAEFFLKPVRSGYLISIILKSKKAIERVPYNLYMPSQKQITIQAS